MNRVKKILIAFTLIFTWQSAVAAEAEVGGMFALTLNKSFNDYFSMNIQNHLWLEENFTHMERYMVGANFKTALIKKHLYFEALYYYRYRNRSGHSENTHRYQFGLSGVFSLPRVKLSGVSKMESNHVFISANDPFNIYFWRNKLAINGILKNNNRISPFGSIEVFNQLNWREDFNKMRGYTNQKGVERIWIDLGVDYKINKNFILTFSVKEQIIFNLSSSSNKPYKYSTMLGIGCLINL